MSEYYMPPSAYHRGRDSGSNADRPGNGSANSSRATGHSGALPGVRRESTWRPGASSSSSSGSGAARAAPTSASAASSSSARPTNAWATRDSPPRPAPGATRGRSDSYYEPPNASVSGNQSGRSRYDDDDRGDDPRRASSPPRDLRRAGDRDRDSDQDRDKENRWRRGAKDDDRGGWGDYRRRMEQKRRASPEVSRGNQWRRDDDRDRDWRGGAGSDRNDRNDRGAWDRRRDDARAVSPDDRDSDRRRERSRSRNASPPRAPRALRRGSPDYGGRDTYSRRSDMDSDSERARPSSPGRRSPSPERKRRASPSPPPDSKRRAPSPHFPDAKRARDSSPPRRRRRSSSPRRSMSYSPPPRGSPRLEPTRTNGRRERTRSPSPPPAYGPRSGGWQDRDQRDVRDQRDRWGPAQGGRNVPPPREGWGRNTFNPPVGPRFSQVAEAPPVKMRQWGRPASRSPSPPPARSPYRRPLTPPSGPRSERGRPESPRRGFPSRHGNASSSYPPSGPPNGRASGANASPVRSSGGHSPAKAGGWKSISTKTALSKDPQPAPSNGDHASRTRSPSAEIADMDMDMEEDDDAPAAASQPFRIREWSPAMSTPLERLADKERQYTQHLHTIAPYIVAAFAQWYSQNATPALNEFLVHYFGRPPSTLEVDQMQQLLSMRTQLSKDQQELHSLHAKSNAAAPLNAPRGPRSEFVPPPRERAWMRQPPPEAPKGPKDIVIAQDERDVRGSELTPASTAPSQSTPLPTPPSHGGSTSYAEPTKNTPAAIAAGEAYERLAQVGEGTYGKVYKARAVTDGALVALKRIRMEQEKDGFPVTSMREIKLLQALRHPNVVYLREMMVSKGSVYMVLEYMNHDLTGILGHPTVKLSPANIKSLNHQMLSGLGYLHRRGILHRDMKGSNILLNGDGELKLADFGLARFYHKHKRDDYTNRVITLWYRSPELLMGETCYGPEVDTWSAGCIMLEIFTTKPVFQGQDEISQLEAIYAILGTPEQDAWPAITELPWYELVRPKEVVPSRFRASFAKWLSPGALDLAQKLLAFDPAQRLLADAALQMPYFTEEEPAMERPTQLAGCGEHHEMSVKLERHRRRDAAK